MALPNYSTLTSFEARVGHNPVQRARLLGADASTGGSPFFREGATADGHCRLIRAQFSGDLPPGATVSVKLCYMTELALDRNSQLHLLLPRVLISPPFTAPPATALASVAKPVDWSADVLIEVVQTERINALETALPSRVSWSDDHRHCSLRCALRDLAALAVTKGDPSVVFVLAGPYRPDSASPAGAEATEQDGGDEEGDEGDAEGDDAEGDDAEGEDDHGDDDDDGAEDGDAAARSSTPTAAAAADTAAAATTATTSAAPANPANGAAAASAAPAGGDTANGGKSLIATAPAAESAAAPPARPPRRPLPLKDFAVSSWAELSTDDTTSVTVCEFLPPSVSLPESRRTQPEASVVPVKSGQPPLLHRLPFRFPTVRARVLMLWPMLSGARSPIC